MKKIALNILFFLSFLISFSQIATYPLNEDLNDTTNSFHGSYNPFSCCDFAKEDGSFYYPGGHCEAISEKRGFDICNLN